MYTIKELASFAQITTRTLRYYDGHSVEMLQQIMFYKTFGLSLEEIQLMINEPNFDKKKVLYSHKEKLENEFDRVEKLLQNINKTIKNMEANTMMTNEEKFEGFKKDLLEENEKNYGDELRELYGGHLDVSTERFQNQSKEVYQAIETLTETMHELFK